eukprot:m.160944 g.160944  ORF g.160944 m.160944 type:complete len:610 (-) comp16514_c0_seq1:48-1877(-)
MFVWCVWSHNTKRGEPSSHLDKQVVNFSMMAASSLYAAYDKLNGPVATESEGNEALKVILEAASSEDARIRRLIVSFLIECAPKRKALAKESAQCFMKLVTDEDPAVSKEAVIGAKRLKQESAFIDQVLQLLLSHVPFKNEQIEAAFHTLAQLHPEELFNQSRIILPDADEDVREALLGMLSKLIEQERAAFAENRAVEESIAACLLKVLEDVSKEEFGMLMPLLKALTIYQQPERATEVVEFLYRLSEASEVKLDDEETLEMFVPCFQQSGELFQRGADSTAFLSTMHNKLLMDLEKLDQATTIILLRATAEGCHSAGLTPEMARTIGPALYAELYNHLPEPEVDDDSDNDDKEDKGEPAAKREKAGTFNYSYIECLLGSVYGCIAKAPSTVTLNELSHLISSLDLVIARTTPYTRGLENTLKVKQASLDEKGLAQVKQLKTALCTIHNIRSYRVLLKHPDDSKAAASIVFSWHPQAQEQSFKPVRVTKGRDSSSQGVAKVVTTKTGKRGRIQGIYQPPSGRYSKNLGKIPEAAVDVNKTSTPQATPKAVSRKAGAGMQAGASMQAGSAGPTPTRRVVKGRGVSRRGSSGGMSSQKKPAASTRIVRKK